jgi:superfamily II DNA or RNA helicase
LTLRRRKTGECVQAIRIVNSEGPNTKASPKKLAFPFALMDSICLPGSTLVITSLWYYSVASTVIAARKRFPEHPEPVPLTPQPGQVLIGRLFSEPMRVETSIQVGAGTWRLGLVGIQTERFRSVTLSGPELATLEVRHSAPTYRSDGALLRLGIQAYSLGIAYEFDPYFALSVSRVDPLPHQLEAVYDYLLKLARVRFLLADDAGAGKTIMAGLLLRELKLRGLVERTLVICPANLTFQWQRELKDKFDESFVVLRGSELRAQYGVNQWLQNHQIITSLDLAKRADILPSLRQARWDFVIIDEAHRMSAIAEDKKSLRYKLGELLRDTTDHYLLLTATPHRGDPLNFTLFLRLLDEDAYADVRSIREAMDRRRAPFYLRRLKEAMVYFPEQQPDGKWVAEKIFTKRIPRSVEFQIDGPEFDLYREVTRFVKAQSMKAAAREDDPRALAVGFLMTLYQRRLASSTFAVRRSLEKRADRLENAIKRGQQILAEEVEIPDPEDLEEMEEGEREKWEDRLGLVSIAQNAQQVREEITELRRLAGLAENVEASGVEAKLSKLRSLLQEQGFFDRADQRLLIFTEYKDTLDYLVEKLRSWGFKVGFIHGGMKPGSREEPGTRLWAEQQFKDGNFQFLVATEAAGEGINLQFCHILFNYDIPWNPNRLEQRMGRIHRYGQKKDCLIFNFVATNTVEGRVLQRLLEKLQEIRDALDDDAVFNVVGEVLPAAHVDRVLRDYYAGKLGEADLESRLLRDVNEAKFRSICQTALEGLATKTLNLSMLVERRARAQERRVVPETIARFLAEAAPLARFSLAPYPRLPHTFDPGSTPGLLRRFEQQQDWRLPPLTNRYPRVSTDRNVADDNNLEWVTPGHPLFEALRRNAFEQAQSAFADGACVYSLRHDHGTGQVVHERLFAVEQSTTSEPTLREPGVLGDLQLAPTPGTIPEVANTPEAVAFLQQRALLPFLEEVKTERVAEVERIQHHVEVSLTELIARADQEIGRFEEDKNRGIEGAAGLLAIAIEKHDQLCRRRERRREELEREKALTLQGVERMASVLILPHPDREQPELRRLRPNPETEATAMRVAMEHERGQGRAVADVHEKDLGYDLTSLDIHSGELRLIEVKGLAASEGEIILTPNEHRVAEDRRDCYWLYVVTNCITRAPHLSTIRNPADKPWEAITKIAHFRLSTGALSKD